MQPRRPQVQRAPSISTTTWPISPAPPRPIHGLPSRIRPPPTPVPQKTPSSELYEPPGAELELGVGRHLHVVADRDPAAERVLPASLSERERALPAGQVARARDVAVVDRARASRRRPRRALRGSSSRRLGGVAQRRRPSPPRRPTGRRSVGVGRRAEPSTLVLVVDDRPPGSWCHRGRSRRSWPSARIIAEAHRAYVAKAHVSRMAAAYANLCPLAGFLRPLLRLQPTIEVDDDDRAHQSILARLRTGGSLRRRDRRRRPASSGRRRAARRRVTRTATVAAGRRAVDRLRQRQPAGRSAS